MKRRPLYTILSAALFFLAIVLVIAAALMVAGLSYFMSGKNITTSFYAVIVTIIFLSVLFTVIHMLNRKVMVEQPAQKIFDATHEISKGNFDVHLTPQHRIDHYDLYDLIMENINIMAEELGKSEVLKTDFISNISHELKTPLSVIQSYASALRNDDLEPDVRVQYIDTVYEASKKLSELVSNMLRLNKLEHQETTPEKVRVMLSDQIAECVINYEVILDKKRLEVETDMDDFRVSVPEGYAEIVWNNLISNAIKFTDDGGKITITAKKNGSDAVVTIADTGCGISPENGAHIFDRFYQGDSSHSSEGNGLGLSMVKNVIDRIGGEISVSSEVGVGTVFTVVLKNVVESR